MIDSRWQDIPISMFSWNWTCQVWFFRIFPVWPLWEILLSLPLDSIFRHSKVIYNEKNVVVEWYLILFGNWNPFHKMQRNLSVNQITRSAPFALWLCSRDASTWLIVGNKPGENWWQVVLWCMNLSLQCIRYSNLQLLGMLSKLLSVVSQRGKIEGILWPIPRSGLHCQWKNWYLLLHLVKLI